MSERSERMARAAGERRSMNDDEKAIVDLTIAYTWALDDRRFEDLRDVFAADATGDLAGVHCEGIDAIIDRIRAGVEQARRTQHVISNQQVRVDGDTATCRCYLVGQHIKQGTPGGDHFIMSGTYSDRLARRPRAGASLHRTLEILWTEGNPAVVGR